SRWKRRRLRFGHEDILHDRLEQLTPATKRVRVLGMETRERFDCFIEVSPPFQDPAIWRNQSDIQFRLDVLSAMAGQVEVTVPRHVCDASMVKGVCVVEVTGA